MSVGQDVGQPGQAAHVGHDRQLDLTHRELRVGTGVANVDRADEVHAATDAPAVDGGDRRGAAVGHRGDRLLHALELAVELHPRPGRDLAGHRTADGVAHGDQVQTVAEVAAGSGQHDGPDVGIRVELGERHRHLRPEGGTMALPLPGPISVTWAT